MMGSETFKVDIFIQTYLKLPIKLIHSEVLIRNHKSENDGELISFKTKLSLLNRLSPKK